MAIRWETTEVEGRSMPMYLGIPDRPGPLPKVLVAHHGPGVNEQMLDVVHRLFRRGYIAAMPKLYYRQPPDLEMRQRVSSLRDEQIIVDLNATVAHVNKVAPNATGPVGIVGFCMGGRISYLAAAEMPELKAAVMFYGSGILQARGNGPSPFDRSAKIQCPILSLSGSEDINSTVEQMRQVEAELKRLNKWHEFHIYENSPHSFQDFSDPRYRERAARASWGEMLAFFDEQFKRAMAED